MASPEQSRNRGPGDEGAEQRQSSPDTSSSSGEAYAFASITRMWANLDKPRSMTLMVLVFVNLINYMDRSTVAGMLTSIKDDPHFHITKDSSLGLLQTAFVLCYMIFAPLFGYLGDRYNRKIILMIGLTFWFISTMVGSFMTNFWWFLAFRAFVGIGEASYSTIAPAIISDLFHKDARSKALALFYFAIPVGTGFGYIVGSTVAAEVGDWRWGLR
jgi:MFS family permease